jgi:hypothetical protein
MALQYLAALSFLFGFFPRLCAWFLAAAGFYVISLDPEHYSHNAQFHLTLLALAGCSRDRVTLWQLLREGETGNTCPAWPEILVRIQVSIVFFYAALDKVFSPYWSLSGGLLAAMALTEHGRGLARLQSLNQSAIRAFPSVMSVVIATLEFSLAVVFQCRSWWRVGIVVASCFVMYLEFLLRPGVFAWDMLAAFFVMVPAGDRGWALLHDPECSRCRWNRALLARLDWLRRTRWVATSGALSYTGLHLISPRGWEYHGFRAFRMLPFVFPGPVFVALVLARFGGGFLASRGFGHWDDLPYLMLGALLALWVPEIPRVVNRSFRSTLRPRAADSRDEAIPE